MKTVLIKTIALTAVLALAALGGCSSSDDPAAPPGGGSSGFVLPAGIYNMTIDNRSCAGDPIYNESYLEISCSAESVDDLPGGLACKPTPVGSDSVTVNCSGTEVNGSCSFDWTATGGGTKVGDTWTLNVRVEYSNVVGCPSQGPCVDMVLTAETIDSRPTACNYADVNQFESTISGGPMAGQVPFAISNANGVPQPGGPEWNFGGAHVTYDVLSAQTSGGRGRGHGFDVYLSSIDPKSLPVTHNVTTGNTGVASTGGGDFVYYREWDSTSGYIFDVTGGGGTVTVQEMDNGHIAGTMNLSIDGTETGGSGVSATQTTTTRHITGGFYVDLRKLQQDRSTNDVATQIGRELLNSLRQYVR